MSLKAVLQGIQEWTSRLMKIQATREDRFLRLLEEHSRILYKIANVHCTNSEDRKDLAQEIVIQLWKAYPRYDDAFKFSTWMYRIAMNVAISFHRSTGRRNRDTVSTESLDVIDFVAADRVMSDAADDLLALRQLIARLDRMSRALIFLYLDGHSHGEIAEILGISATNVGTRIGRMKQRLQREFDEPSDSHGRKA